MLASQLLISPGDRVVTVTPLWPNAVEIPKIVSAQVECVSLEVREGGWILPLRNFSTRSLPARGCWCSTRQTTRPDGQSGEREEQRVIFEHCRRLGIWILADDVYERLIFRDDLRTAPSFLTLSDPDDRLIVVNSFSKAWTMTGWRVGWIIGPASNLPRPCAADRVQHLIRCRVYAASRYRRSRARGALRLATARGIGRNQRQADGRAAPASRCRSAGSRGRHVCLSPHRWAERLDGIGQKAHRRGRSRPRTRKSIRAGRRRLAPLVLCTVDQLAEAELRLLGVPADEAARLTALPLPPIKAW